VRKVPVPVGAKGGVDDGFVRRWDLGGGVARTALERRNNSFYQGGARFWGSMRDMHEKLSYFRKLFRATFQGPIRSVREFDDCNPPARIGYRDAAIIEAAGRKAPGDKVPVPHCN